MNNFFCIMITSLLAMSFYFEKSLISTTTIKHQLIRCVKNDANVKETMFTRVYNFCVEYSFLFEIVLITTLPISLLDHLLQINDIQNLQITMTILCFTFIFVPSFIMYQRLTFTNKLKPDQSISPSIPVN